MPDSQSSIRHYPSDYITAAYYKVLKIHHNLPKGSILVFLSGRREVNRLCSLLRSTSEQLRVLPFYSMLPLQEQRKVFQPCPDIRCCIVATNVAETSLTIPSVKYVIDSGREKKKFVDKRSGVSHYRVDWISQASSQQRAGRAGRTSDGFCYRLYSSAVYDDFLQFTPPEITTVTIESVVLLLKKMHVVNPLEFSFPTAPSREAVEAAEGVLMKIGALGEDKTITELGKRVCDLPLHPRLGKLVVHARKNGVMDWGLNLVVGMTVAELVGEGGERLLRERRELVAGSPLGDLMLLVRVMEMAESMRVDYVAGKYGLREKALVEGMRLKRQLGEIEGEGNGGSEELVQLVVSCYPDHVARRVDGVRYESPLLMDELYIHPDSVMAGVDPDYVLFTSLEETNKLYMKGICAVNPAHLPHCAPRLCRFFPVRDDPPPRYCSGTVLCYRECHFGGLAWDLGCIETEFPSCLKRTCYFARFFLEGKVCSPLRKYSAYLLGNPGMLTTSYSSLQRKASDFISAFCRRRVDSGTGLRNAWGEDAKYLLKEYLEYIPVALKDEVMAVWTSLVDSL